MGSGGRRKKNRGIISIPRAKRVTTAREGALITATAQGHSGTVRPMRSEDQCQTFGLVRLTNAARSVAAGMAISGVFDDPRVTVRSQAGDLGDAPSQAARYFIEQREVRGGGTLKGFVLKSTPREVRVRLCLN